MACSLKAWNDAEKFHDEYENHVRPGGSADGRDALYEQLIAYTEGVPKDAKVLLMESLILAAFKAMANPAKHDSMMSVLGKEKTYITSNSFTIVDTDIHPAILAELDKKLG